jgi:prepilin-type N-terminal cleavage/methylation domain-containing protein/prepilin-type processing-associated H-X9-DG protein
MNVLGETSSMVRAKTQPGNASGCRAAFTLIEVLVVVAIIALLIAILLPSLHRAREMSKRTICLHNERMLGQAWYMYQIDNKGSFLYGGASTNPKIDSPPGWVRYIPNPTQQPEQVQIQSIKDGALFKYARVVDLYRCPSRLKNEIRTYEGNFGVAGVEHCPWAPEPSTWRIDQLKRPAGRIVYQDDSPKDWDAIWYIPWDSPVWWNHLQAMHDKGSTFSFADGHSEYWRWTNKRTLDFCAMDWDTAENQRGTIPGDKNNRDFIRIELAIWGSLGFPYP